MAFHIVSSCDKCGRMIAQPASTSDIVLELAIATLFATIDRVGYKPLCPACVHAPNDDLGTKVLARATELAEKHLAAMKARGV